MYKSRKSKIPLVNTELTWRVAWGSVDTNYEDIAWRDEKVAVILPHTASGVLPEKFAIASGEQFVVVGDLWLTNQAQLLQNLGVESNTFELNPLKLVANLWERSGLECLNQLVGMFALVVWDREKQVLWLVRDRSLFEPDANPQLVKLSR